MSKGKNAPEMFEAFHRMGRTEPPGEPVKKPVEPRREPLAQPRPAARPQAGGGMLNPPASSQAHVFPLGRRADVVFAMSYNALVVAGVVLFFAALLMGFIGYRLGQGAQPVAETPKETPKGKELAVGVVDGRAGESESGNSKGTGQETVKQPWRVLISRYSPSKKDVAENTLKFLESQGIPELELMLSNDKKDLGLFAGRFDDRASAERLAARIRPIVYQGKKQFTEAGPYDFTPKNK